MKNHFLIFQITKEKLQQIFSEKGQITDVQLKYTKDGKFRKFCFVGFKTPEQASAVIETFNKTFINASQIQVIRQRERRNLKKFCWISYDPVHYTTVNKCSITSCFLFKERKEKRLDVIHLRWNKRLFNICCNG